MMNSLKNPLMLALDVDSDQAALGLAQKVSASVGALKVGPRLVLRYGAGFISKLAELAPVFVDCKFLDIPSTMDAAVRAAFEAGASYATVHAWAGADALTKLGQTEKELNAKRPFKILAVSILTSFNEKNLPPPLEKFPIAEQVQGLVDLASRSGLSGFVCSPREARELRTLHPKSFLVTPGVRMLGDASGDQQRVATPKEAMSLGASALVVGRSILEASDPVAKLELILESLK